MKKRQQFKIESVEELKEAYEMFKDEWSKAWSFDRELGFFNDGYRWIVKDSCDDVYLEEKNTSYHVIPSPLKKEKIKRLEKELAELKKLPKIKLQVHKRFKYMAVSRLGRIVLSENKLKKIDVYWGGENIIIIDHLPQKTIDYLKSFSWSESLHEIDHIE